MTTDWQPMETAPRDGTMTDLQVVYLDPGWLHADVERVKRRTTFRRWCISLTDDEITAVVRFIAERRAAMTTATWINHSS